MRNTPMNLFTEINSIISDAIYQINSSNVNQKREQYQLFSSPEGWATRIDLPGYSKDDLSLRFEDDALNLTAENEQRGKQSIRFALGDEVEASKISAKLEHGVLEISLPRKEETKPESKQIEIN